MGRPFTHPQSYPGPQKAIFRVLPHTELRVAVTVSQRRSSKRRLWQMTIKGRLGAQKRLFRV